MKKNKTYNQEQKELFKTFIDKSFFKSYKTLNKDNYNEIVKSDQEYLINYNSLELQFDYHCDLNCTYCYYTKHGKDLYGGKSKLDNNKILKNLDDLMRFIYNNKMSLGLDLFSGELFVLPYVWDIFKIIYKWQKKTEKKYRLRHISVPTNLSFIKDQNKSKNLMEKLLNWKNKFMEIDVILHLSSSFDGPFLDNTNRPENNKKEYNKKFYDNAGKYLKDFNYGFHPMIYSNNIEYWLDNMLWFGDNFKYFYLLEVRNIEWSKENIRSFYYTFRSIINLIYKKCGSNLDKFIEHMDNNKYYNIFNHIFSTTGRGIGCSIQSTLQIALHDMTVSPCHRLSYDIFKAAKFDFSDLKNKGIYDIEPINIETYMTINAITTESLHPCHNCPINKICNGGCLGSNYEATGELFSVPPTVCALEHAKTEGIIRGFHDIGALDFIKNIINDKRIVNQIDFVLKTSLKLEGDKK